MKNIGFIGLGKLGLPCAEAMARAGHNLFGYDIEQKDAILVKQISSIKKMVAKCDIVFIAVPTPQCCRELRDESLFR